MREKTGKRESFVKLEKNLTYVNCYEFARSYYSNQTHTSEFPSNFIPNCDSSQGNLRYRGAGSTAAGASGVVDGQV